MLDRAAGSLPPSQAPAALCPILVGRDHPFNALLALWAQARNGAGRLALIAGEAGVGKTRLLRELRVHLRADTPTPCSLVGHCFEPDQTVPYAAITDLLRTLYASQAAEMRPELFGRWALELARLLPEWVELIPGQQTFDVTLEPDQRRLLYSLTQLLAHLARTRPVLAT